MLRKTMIALAATVALGAVSFATDAAAQHRGPAGAGIRSGAPVAAARTPMAAPRTSMAVPRGPAGNTRFVGPAGNTRFNAVGPRFSRNFDHDRRFHHRRFFPGVVAAPFIYGAGPYAYDYNDYNDSGCYQLQQVWTDWGWSVRRVYVCD